MLEAADIWKSYGGVAALRGADLSLTSGEVMGLVGANGAGKSTLVRILTGDTRPDRGRLTLDGAERSFTTVDEAHRHGIGFVPQELDLVPDLSVAANIMLNMESRFSRRGFIQRAALERAAGELLERVGLAVMPGAALAALSLGDRQLVAVARALRDAARALILDEPTSSLTPWEAQRLLKLIRSLAEDGVATLFISHRLGEVVEISDRISVLRDGQMVARFDRASADSTRIAAAMIPSTRGPRGASLESRATGEVVLRVRDLVVGRHGPADFEVAQGEVVGFFGLVGAGRSSIGRALVGAVRPTGGVIELHGRARAFGSTFDAYAAGIGFLSEDRKAESVFTGMSVADNISVRVPAALRRWGTFLDGAAITRLVLSMMQRLAIKAPGKGALIETLSGGNQQKASLARLLAEDLSVLVLDEPTHGIDVSAKADLLTELDRLADAGMAIIVIGSELDQLIEAADRILVFRQGRVVAEYPSHEADDVTLVHLASGAAA